MARPVNGDQDQHTASGRPRTPRESTSDEPERVGSRHVTAREMPVAVGESTAQATKTTCFIG